MSVDRWRDKENVVYGLVTRSCSTFATLWNVAHQALLSMGFPRQEYWSRFPFPSPGDLPNPGIEPTSLAYLARYHRAIREVHVCVCVYLCLYNRIVFSHEKEGNPVICHNMDEARGHYAKWNKSDLERQILYDHIYMWNTKKLNS